MRETWKPRPGYEGIYETSNRGAVRTVQKAQPHGGVLKPYDIKLTEQDVREIRLLGPYDSHALLAEHYGVTKALISCILLGKTWENGPSGAPRLPPGLPRPPSWAWENAEIARRHH